MSASCRLMTMDDLDAIMEVEHEAFSIPWSRKSFTEELERDAYGLVPKLDGLSDEPGNRFTDYDVACALSAYGSNDLRFWKNEYMCRRAKISPHENKHNGRPQGEHLKIARFARDLNYDEPGGWINKNGAPTKRDEIRAYAAEHPEASQRAVAKALGVSPTTVNKWLKPDQEHGQGKASAEKLDGAKMYVKTKLYAGEIAGGAIDLSAFAGLLGRDSKE